LFSDSPIRWSDPTTWPWIIYLWLALLAGNLIWTAWKRWRKSGAREADWPFTDGTITATNVVQPKNALFSQGNQQAYKAELNYTYSVEGNFYGGRYTCEFPTESEGWEFVRDLVGKPVRVQYNFNKAKQSAISLDDIQALLRKRAPRRDDGPLVPLSPPVPAWLRPFAWIFIGLSAFGLAVSLWVHVNALFGKQVVPDAGFFLLHVGIFVVWAPAVFAATRLSTSIRFSWKVVLRGAPAWMRYIAFAFFAYAVINVFSFYNEHNHNFVGASGNEWKGFSGHWMVFYSMSIVILYSAARIQDPRARCAHGHLVSDTADYCAECGLPMPHKW
jgi:hypothetical protein